MRSVIGKSGGRTLRHAALVAFLVLGATATSAQAPEGIPRDLARLRAQQLQDVRYQLSYTITPKADSVSGHEELRFVQNADDRGILQEWLDFREGEISSLAINGQPASTQIQNGHVELPAKLLKLGENVATIFAAVVLVFKACDGFSRRSHESLKIDTSTRCSFQWTPIWRFRVSTSRTSKPGSNSR